MGLFSDVIVPALPVLARLEERGIPLDVARRDAERKKATETIAATGARILDLVNAFHGRRMEMIQRGIDDLQQRAEVAEHNSSARCAKHPEYLGRIRRSKCAGCVEVFELGAPVRQAVGELRKRIGKGRTKLKQVGGVFDLKNNNHWRWLLFDPDGLGLQPVTRSTKKKVPQVNDRALEVLQKRHPDVELLRLRIEAQKATSRLRTRLKVEPDENGRVHFAYSMHRTPARLSSGADSEEADKVRTSPGNAQNIPDRDRRMYVAEKGKLLVSADYSQIEARVFAWLARDLDMLRAWQSGLDIHVENAHVLARAIGFALERGKEDVTPFPFDPQKKSFRHNGKLTHKLHYGMRKRKFSQSYGIPERVCARIIEEYFRAHPALARFQREEYERASEQRWLRDNFGRKMAFWNYGQRDGKWQLLDREEALAYRSQNNVAWMCVTMLTVMEELASGYGGELLTTTHDSFLSQIPEREVSGYVQAARPALERAWPQLGEIEGFGMFSCPVDFADGSNWGDHNAEDNPFGLVEYDGGHRAEAV